MSNSNAADRFTYLLIGAGIGAALALLFAPKSGKELRGDIAEVSRRTSEKVPTAPRRLVRKLPRVSEPCARSSRNREATSPARSVRASRPTGRSATASESR